jgi:hypothetical protein
MDEFVDALLHEDEVLGIPLPRLVARRVLEETGQLEPWVSVLQDEFEFVVERERRRQGDDEESMRRRKQRKHVDDHRVSHSPSSMLNHIYIYIYYNAKQQDSKGRKRRKRPGWHEEEEGIERSNREERFSFSFPSLSIVHD